MHNAERVFDLGQCVSGRQVLIGALISAGEFLAQMLSSGGPQNYFTKPVQGRGKKLVLNHFLHEIVGQTMQ